ncbi:hypothetical protein EVAR_75926_1 [Eumeta japonica]|uniref:Uncharacterized protein n=1 Tax=Eumeta variegata TaxID=151549 RepID=A0A4C1UW41_EUMVA|nr:hypothetical protein EVAR_75926_1 [Eumeta japonica]
MNTERDTRNITADEYNAYSAKNVQLAGQEVAGARLMRVYVDSVLKQVPLPGSELFLHEYINRAGVIGSRTKVPPELAM